MRGRNRVLQDDERNVHRRFGNSHSCGPRGLPHPSPRERCAWILW